MVFKDTIFLSSTGKKKEQNEDSYYANPEKGILIVADGLGGKKSGAIASTFTVQSFANYLLNEISLGKNINADILRDAIDFTNLSVNKKSKADPIFDGMQSTIVAVALSDNKLNIVNVGDSRLYLYREEQLFQLTNDQTLVQEMVNNKIISEEKARHHHLRHMIANTVGRNEKIIPELLDNIIKEGDRLLICTDGLTEMMDDLEILQVLNMDYSSLETCNVLINKAVLKGGNDDITVGITALKSE